MSSRHSTLMKSGMPQPQSVQLHPYPIFGHGMLFPFKEPFSPLLIHDLRGLTLHEPLE